jgi:hypothetical protein
VGLGLILNLGGGGAKKGEVKFHSPLETVLKREKRVGLLAVKGTYVGSAAHSSRCRNGKLERKERNRPETAGTRKKSRDTSCSITTVEETV